MKFVRSLAIAGLAAVLSWGAVAQPLAYPNKAVKVVVGYAPGGAVDVVARTIGQSLQTTLGQPLWLKTSPGPAPTLPSNP